MTILWICGLPEEVRQRFGLTDVRGAAWSWVMGSLPPPNGVELHLVCPVFGMLECERHFDYEGAHWHCFKLDRFEPLFLRRRFTRKIRPFVRQLKPDVIHGWGGESGCGLIATYLSNQAVVSVQGLLRMLAKGIRDWGLGISADERGLAYWLRCLMEAMTYRRARCLICESETAQAWLKSCYGQDAAIVPYPLRKEFISTPFHSAASQSRLTILFIGQDVPRKGYQDAVKACEGTATLVKVEGKSVAELVELMRSVDAMIVPSYGDTGPTALKEALSQGIYPIVYDNTGAAELVCRYGSGMTVPTGDVEALRAAVKKLADKGFVGRNVEVAERVRADLGREKAWNGFLETYSRVGFALPPAVLLQGAVGQRVRHFAKMLQGFSFADKVVISFHTGVRQNLMTVIRAKFAGRKIIREINEWPLSVTWGESRLKQWIEIYVLPKFFDGFICITDVLVDFCRAHGRKDVPILKVPMTVDYEEIRCTPTPNPYTSPHKRVVYAGSMTETKDGVETLKRAMVGIDAELLMVSGRSHDEAVTLMKTADCLVLARPDSQQARAGFPTKLGEYLATGVPVVVTRTGEIGCFLKDGESAFLAEPGNVADIAAKIQEVLSDPERAKRIGERGRKVATHCFDWRNHAKELTGWLRQFI